MPTFFTEHIEIVLLFITALISLLGLAISTIAGLLIYIVKQFTKSNDNLSAAIVAVESELRAGRKEAKEDRENDHKVIGKVFHHISEHNGRLTAIESRCEATQKYCKHLDPHYAKAYMTEIPNGS